MENEFVTPEIMAGRYWHAMRARAIYDVELKLSRYTEATPETKEYWADVLSRLKKKASFA